MSGGALGDVLFGCGTAQHTFFKHMLEIVSDPQTPAHACLWGDHPTDPDTPNPVHRETNIKTLEWLLNDCSCPMQRCYGNSRRPRLLKKVSARVGGGG